MCNSDVKSDRYGMDANIWSMFELCTLHELICSLGNDCVGLR